MADDHQIQPIYKKIKKVAAGGHGGGWKVAYADFVTAMMAFFLLMWLLNSTSQEQKRGISNYFGPIGMSEGSGGSGGLMGGLSVTSEGSFQDSAAAPAVTMMTPKSSPGDTEDSENTIENGTTKDQTGISDEVKKKFEEAKVKDKPKQEFKKIETSEKNVLLDVQKQIKQAIQANPELKDLSQNLMIDLTPEGLRIQLVDQDKKSMFPSGKATPLPQMEKLVQQVSKVISKLPNKISISGHTDSTPYGNDKTYSNWELSTDRANVTRRMILDDGIDEARIEYVRGKAANDPLIKADPSSPQNRRISIVILNNK